MQQRAQQFSSLESVLTYLRGQKRFLREEFGVTRIGIFGSLARGEGNPSSDIDMVVEMEARSKDIHTFLGLKRFLEREMARRVDLGFENALKPFLRERVKGEIVYV